MSARQLALFEDRRPAMAVTTFTGAAPPSTIREHPLDSEAAYLVTVRCSAVLHKIADGSLVRSQTLTVVDGRVVDTDWAVAKIADLAAAEEAEAEQAARERFEEQGITAIDPDEEDDR